jgi:hypothetical protein
MLAHYFGLQHILKLPENVKELDTGKVLLTTIGSELARVAGARPDETYRVQTVNKWREARIEVIESAFASPPVYSCDTSGM